MNKIMKQQQSKSRPELVSGSPYPTATSNGFRTKSGMTGRDRGWKWTPVLTALALAFSVAVATSASALECDSTKGILFQGKNNGTFCMSKVKMNWFSAFSFCNAVGGHLATMGEACGGLLSCSNLNKPEGAIKDYVWTATPKDNSLAYNVNLSSGVVNANGRYASSFSYALCK